jgi:hypothetical protein
MDQLAISEANVNSETSNRKISESVSIRTNVVDTEDAENLPDILIDILIKQRQWIVYLDYLKETSGYDDVTLANELKELEKTQEKMRLWPNNQQLNWDIQLYEKRKLFIPSYVILQPLNKVKNIFRIAIHVESFFKKKIMSFFLKNQEPNVALKNLAEATQITSSYINKKVDSLKTQLERSLWPVFFLHQHCSILKIGK